MLSTMLGPGDKKSSMASKIFVLKEFTVRKSFKINKGTPETNIALCVN